MECDHANLGRFASTADLRFRKFFSEVKRAVIRTMCERDLPVFSKQVKGAPAPIGSGGRPPSPLPTTPVSQPASPKPSPKSWSGPQEEHNQRINYWKQRAQEEQTQKQRAGFLESLKGWTGQNTGKSLVTVPGTCSWVVDDYAFLFWRTQRDCGTMFILGDAGRGKSHLARDIVQRLKAVYTADVVMSFHCSPGEKPAVWEYFTWNLISQHPECFDAVPLQHRSRGADSPPMSAGTFADIWNALRTHSAMRDAWLIVDGLEQTSDDIFKEFLDSVQKLRTPITMPPGSLHSEPTTMKILFLARPTPATNLARSRLTFTGITAPRVQADVEKYVESRLGTGDVVLGSGSKLHESDLSILEGEIVASTGSYWPFARFAVEEAQKVMLLGKRLSVDVHDHMPWGLRTWLRGKMLAQLQKPSLDSLARAVFTFLAGTPVNTIFLLATLKDALLIFQEDGKGHDLAEAITRDWGDFIGISLDEERRTGFVHGSIAHVARSLLPPEQHGLNCAFLCMNYLLLEDFAEIQSLPASDSHDYGPWMERLLQQHLFYDYAGAHFLQGLAASGKLGIQLLPLLRAFFDRECPQYRTWCIWDLRSRNVPIDRAQLESPIVLKLVKAGCVDLLEYLLPPPEATLAPKSSKRSFFTKLISHKDHEESFLEAEDWPETSDCNGHTPLIAAIMSRQKQAADLVLQYNPDINACSIWRETALMTCFGVAHATNSKAPLRLVEELICRGADVNTFDGDTGLTPLHYAAESGDVEGVRLLLSYGARVDTSSVIGYSPLEAAIVSGDVATFAEIVDHGADVDVISSLGSVLLCECIQKDERKMFEILLPLCDVNKSSAWGMTPLNEASRRENRNSYIKRLTEHPDINIDALEQLPGVRSSLRRVKAPENALSLSVRSRNYCAVEMLLHAGADPGMLPGMGASPVYLAVEIRDVEIVKLLLRFNAPVNACSPIMWPRTALPLAVEYQDETLVDVLLEHGADPTIEDAYGPAGVLSVAIDVIDPNLRIVQMLLSARIPADVNAPDSTGYLPISAAVDRNNIDLVHALLDHGLDLSMWLQPHRLRSPLVRAAARGNIEICKLLLEREPGLLNAQFQELGNNQTPLSRAAQDGRANTVRFLLERGALPSILTTIYRESPLFLACQKGHLECVKILLEAAPEMVDVPDATGCLPWHIALDGCNLKILEALLDAGASWAAKDRFGNSYLARGVFENNGPSEKVIELLIKHGLDINAPQDACGRNALSLAIHFGKARHVKWLLSRGADPRLCEHSFWIDGRWETALAPATEAADDEILDLLLEPQWGLLEHLGDIDEYGRSILSFGYNRLKPRILQAFDAHRSATGHDLLGDLLSRPNVLGLTPVDEAMGSVAIRPSARAATKALVIDHINKVLALPIYSHNDHQELVYDIGYELLRFGGYDSQASALLSRVVSDPFVDKNDEGRYETLTARQRCAVCGEDIMEIAFSCRFCWRWRCRDCRDSFRTRDPHDCDVVEVPIANDDSFDLMKTLRTVVADLEAHDTPSPDIKEDTQVSPDEAHLQSTLQLATLHAFNLLAFHRPLFTPFLDLAPSVQELIDPWRDLIYEQRSFWEMDNMLLETHWTRRWQEMRYLNRGLARAYVDAEDVKMTAVLGDVERLFNSQNYGDGGEKGRDGGDHEVDVPQ